MTEEVTPKIRTLKGEAALDLWREGPDAWNNWIHQHPGTDISFSGVDFSHYRDADGNLSFAGYHFGDGNVNFSNAIFGDGKVNFSDAAFGNSNLYFIGAIFGKGDVAFSDANFGKGEVHFSGTNFGDGNVYFSGANFGDGDVNFPNVIFGTGEVYFFNTSFGNGNLDFTKTTFADGGMNFTGTTFGDGTINFSFANLEESYAIFFNVSFGNGKLDFSGTKFKELLFNPQEIGSNHILAHGMSIKRGAVFTLPSSGISLKSFELFGASFDGPLFLSGNLGIVPDIRATRYSHQVDLSALTVKLRRRWQKPGRRTNQLRVKAVSQTGIISRLAYKFARKKWINLRHFNKLRRLWKHHCWPIKLSQVAEDPQDAARLRRLKEIAETNKDHQAALRFSADENRAKRWIETSWFGSVLDMAFSAFSDYGQNILRPFVALIVLTAASMGLYKTLGTATFTNWWAGWAQGAVLSASNSLPFLPQSRDLRTDALTALYGTDHSLSVDALMITQGVLSFIFLFLIGLGLRNRFRL